MGGGPPEKRNDREKKYRAKPPLTGRLTKKELEKDQVGNEERWTPKVLSIECSQGGTLPKIQSKVTQTEKGTAWGCHKSKRGKRKLFLRFNILLRKDRSYTTSKTKDFRKY